MISNGRREWLIRSCIPVLALTLIAYAAAFDTSPPCANTAAGPWGDCTTNSNCDDFLQEYLCTHGRETYSIQNTCVSSEGTECYDKSMICYKTIKCKWVDPTLGAPYCAYDADLAKYEDLKKSTRQCGSSN